MQPTPNNQQYKTRINGYIRSDTVQVILTDGTNAGIMELYKAIKLASDQSLDLIEINPKAIPPICRIASFGKLQYDEKKKKQKQKQKSSEQKIIEMSPNIDTHDLEHKLNKSKEFLEDGNKVKLTVKFHGRQLQHKSLGQEKLEYCLSVLKDLIAPPPPIEMLGKDMYIIVSPSKS